MLVHVVDVSHPQAAKQADTVFRILDDLAVNADIPMVTVWNKVDLRPDGDVVRAVAGGRPDTVAVSGETGEGVADLEVTIEAALEEAMVAFEMTVPYDRGELVRRVREQVRPPLPPPLCTQLPRSVKLPSCQLALRRHAARRSVPDCTTPAQTAGHGAQRSTVVLDVGPRLAKRADVGCLLRCCLWREAACYVGRCAAGADARVPLSTCMLCQMHRACMHASLHMRVDIDPQAATASHHRCMLHAAHNRACCACAMVGAEWM